MELFGKEKTNGFFFEAGAYDGVQISNTLPMEIYQNWTGRRHLEKESTLQDVHLYIFEGILVEANPDSYSKLLDAHRNVWSLGQCLSRKTTPETVLFDAAGVFGGILRDGVYVCRLRAPHTCDPVVIGTKHGFESEFLQIQILEKAYLSGSTSF